MGFASEYLSHRALFEPFILSGPDRNTSIIVIIPAYNEPDVLKTINSLASCHKPDCSVEVIIHVNASQSAGKKELEVNAKSIKEIESRKKEKSLPFRLYVFDTGLAPVKGWGAGLARKIAMDEALRRYNSINKPEGLIVSLDADCGVDKNYLVSLYKDFFKKPERNACSIYFEHPTDGDEFSDNIYKAISAYELHLRYYYQGLKYSLFPEVFHTVGSAFSVRAGTYVKSGGMNRQQAGEDFYFIQKIIPAGGYFYLNSTTVFPSPRLSDRVPFGTGPAIRDILHNSDLSFKTYNPESFQYLKDLFVRADRLYEVESDDQIIAFSNNLNIKLLAFLERENWLMHLKEIKSNTASQASFKKRFFLWFNMFKIVKYLNWIHSDGGIKKTDLGDAANQLLQLNRINFKSFNVSELLRYYRNLER